jgi:hypothetical protein
MKFCYASKEPVLMSSLSVLGAHTPLHTFFVVPTFNVGPLSLAYGITSAA